MARLMLDSTDPADIPTTYRGERPALIMGYVDDPRVKAGRWTAAQWDLARRRFPDAVLVRLCIYNDRYDAHMIDLEPGNNDAAAAVSWIAKKWERKEIPSVYCFSDAGPVGYRISDVRAECRKAGVAEPLVCITDFRREAKDLDPAGDKRIVALQYAGEAKTGGHFDASAVVPFWPGVDEINVEGLVGPIFSAQSVMHLKAAVGEAVLVQGIWLYNGRERTIARKLVQYDRAVRSHYLYPPADPDADPTEVLSAQPAVFVLDTFSLA